MAANIRCEPNVARSRSDLTVEELLNRTLLDLVQTQSNPELDTFLLYLKGLCPDIPASDLAEATRPAIVRVLTSRDRANSISMTLKILRMMGKNHLANELSQASGVQG